MSGNFLLSKQNGFSPKSQKIEKMAVLFKLRYISLTFFSNFIANQSVSYFSKSYTSYIWTKMYLLPVSHSLN